MAKAIKKKITEIAKDFELKSKDVLEYAKEAGMDLKNTTSSIEEEQINILLDVIMQKNEVEDFSMYVVKKEVETTTEGGAI